MVMRRDGQSHSVDSNEIAFRTAAKMAVLESMMKASLAREMLCVSVSGRMTEPTVRQLK